MSPSRESPRQPILQRLPNPAAALPAGKRCDLCREFERFCRPVLFRKGDEVECEWVPVKFTPLPI